MSFSRPSVFRPATRLLLVLTLVPGLLGVATTTGAAPAQASGVSATTSYRALAYGATRNGAPYLYGAVGPRRFDCSGFTKWSYANAGRTLPRTTTQQYGATFRISRSYVHRGDLVFFMSGRSTYHVGIYAGAGRVWHAPKAGDHVRLAKIWTSAVIYRRVR